MRYGSHKKDFTLGTLGTILGWYGRTDCPTPKVIARIDSESGKGEDQRDKRQQKKKVEKPEVGSTITSRKWEKSEIKIRIRREEKTSNSRERIYESVFRLKVS